MSTYPGNALDKTVYTASATSTGGREGKVSTDDGKIDVTLTAPKETGGPGTGSNPEQLFAAGFAACFNGAMGVVAKKSGHDVSGSTVNALVGFGPEGDSYGIEVELKISIPGVDRAAAEELVEATHRFCPYSKATAGNVPVTLTIVDPA